MNLQLGKGDIQQGYSLLSAKISRCLTAAINGSSCERPVFQTYPKMRTLRQHRDRRKWKKKKFTLTLSRNSEIIRSLSQKKNVP